MKVTCNDTVDERMCTPTVIKKIYDEKAELSRHFSLLENGGEPVWFLQPGVSHYPNEEVNIKLDQIVDPAYLLLDIYVKLCKELVQSMYEQGYTMNLT